ncbi:MAG: DUF1311 domain-containing protein [Variovorax sp.]|nr:MAG: DUF1311 domain-containing protein [Variovorax sp.]
MMAMCLAVVAHAAGDAGPSDCKPDGNQQEMNACAADDFRAADAALNIRYSEVMDSLAPPVRIALRAEQRTWLKGRDPACKREAKASEGGSIWPLIYNACLAKSNRQRTAELEAWKGRQR